MMHPLKVFLYHAPADKDAVRDLYLRLIREGVDARLVKDKLLPGQDWKHEIHKALGDADLVIICLSEHFSREEFQRKEVQAAFETALEQLAGDIFTIPVRLEDFRMLEDRGNWQGLDLFEETGYETLMQMLRARADKIGATIQRKEGLLPEVSASRSRHNKSASEEEALEEIQETSQVLVEGPGILLEGPTVELQQPTPPRRLVKTTITTLLVLSTIIMVGMRGSPQFARWYQLTFTSLFGTNQTAASVTGVISKPITKAAHANIVFLIDTTGSMRAGRIRDVKAAVSDFVSRLNDRYLVSFIKFDRNVELRGDFIHDRAKADEAIQSIAVDVVQNESCLYDALYAGTQAFAHAPVEEDTQNIIVLLTDMSPREDVAENCGAHFMDDVRNLQSNYPVSIFTIQIGDPNSVNLEGAVAKIGGRLVSADTEKKIGSALRKMAEEKNLALNKKATSAPMPAETSNAGQVPMVFVPSGEFIMGSSQVYLDAFWIDKTEITNAVYARCVQMGICSAPRSYSSRTRINYYGNPEFYDYPVIFVSWTDADKYCVWAGGRLPTEAEWEKAARGTDGRPFPWGSSDPTGIGGFLNYRAQDTDQAGAHPSDASPYGVLDMAGNVAEWVADWFSIDYYNHLPASNPLGPETGQYRVWRGGSWANTSTDSLHTYSRTGNLPTDASAGLGFRCARSAAP